MLEGLCFYRHRDGEGGKQGKIWETLGSGGCCKTLCVHLCVLPRWCFTNIELVTAPQCLCDALAQFHAAFWTCTVAIGFWSSGVLWIYSIYLILILFILYSVVLFDLIFLFMTWLHLWKKNSSFSPNSLIIYGMNTQYISFPVLQGEQIPWKRTTQTLCSSRDTKSNENRTEIKLSSGGE